MRDKKLREILKRGDPAAEGGLAPEEIQAMRRAVLAAVPEPRRRSWLVPAFAGAAALILAAVIALSLWRPAPEKAAVRPPLPPAGEGRGEGPVVVEKTPPLPSPASQEREPPAPEKKKAEPVPEKKKPVRRAPEPETVVLAQVEPPIVPEAASHGSTQIQFSTPGGTRIIWVLQPATE